MKNHNRQRRQLLQASGVVLLLGRAQLAWGPKESAAAKKPAAANPSPGAGSPWVSLVILSHFARR